MRVDAAQNSYNHQQANQFNKQSAQSSQPPVQGKQLAADGWARSKRSIETSGPPGGESKQGPSVSPGMTPQLSDSDRQEASKGQATLRNAARNDGSHVGWGGDRWYRLDAMKDFFKKANPNVANEAVSKFLKEDKDGLKGVVKNMNDYTFAASGSDWGFNPKEKGELFGHMARKLDGANLGEMERALDKREDVLKLADAVAENKESDKVGFIDAIRGRMTDGDKGPLDSPSILDTRTETADKEALAGVKVLSSMKDDPKSFTAGIDVLDKGSQDEAGNPRESKELDAVIKAGEGEIEENTRPVPFFPRYSYDPKGLNSLLDAAANSKDTGMKARVFTAATKALDDMRTPNNSYFLHEKIEQRNPQIGDQTKGVVDRMTKLLDEQNPTATRETIDKIGHRDDKYGRAMTTYVKELLQQHESSDNKSIGRLVASLQGKGSGKEPLDFFNEADPRPVKDREGNVVGTDFIYHNAGNLGYFGGAVGAAIDALDRDSKDEREQRVKLFSSVVSGVAGIAGEIPHAGFVIGEASTFAGQQYEALEKRWLDEIQKDREKLRDGLIDLIRPERTVEIEDQLGNNDFQNTFDKVYSGRKKA